MKGGAVRARAPILKPFLLAEGLVFGAASLVHSDFVQLGHAHRRAAMAEGVIGAILLASLAACFAWPPLTRRNAIGAQGFALLGTMVGLLTIALGVGPQTVADLAVHAVMLGLLLAGLLIAMGQPRLE